MLKKILKGLGVLIIIFVAVVLISLFFAQKAPPPLLVANFTNLDKIEKISTRTSWKKRLVCKCSKRGIRKAWRSC